MKKTVSFWGGRKFKGVWNKLVLKGSISVNFTTYSKDKIADYFCAHNPYGIKKEDLGSGKPSGSVVKGSNGKTYALYFVNSSTESAGALLANASLKIANKNGVDELIIIGALNNASASNIQQKRVDFENKLKDWDLKVVKKKTFHQTFWMPQTDKEKGLILKGQWARRATL